jgi:probable rRNA maturation factor
MEINVLVDEEFAGKVEDAWLVGLVNHILTEEKAHSLVELGVVITGQDTVQELNRQYLGEEEPTDVLSFSAQEERESNLPPFVQPPDNLLHLGEVIINYPQAEIQAGEHGHSAAKEVAVLTIHGVLHLLGYDHDEPERTEAMKARESAILDSLKPIS